MNRMHNNRPLPANGAVDVRGPNEAGIRMDEDAVRLLERVAQSCHKQAPPSQEHWDQLYALAIHVHQRGVPVPSPAVRQYLTRHGCSFQKANWASGEYRRFVELLTVYEKQKGRMHHNGEQARVHVGEAVSKEANGRR
jgi:hypothetical protein